MRAASDGRKCTAKTRRGVREKGRLEMLAEPDMELDQLAHLAIGVGIEVHRHIGPGYNESVYENADCIELEIRGIPYKRQVSVSVTYKGRIVGEGRIDVVIADRLVVELKAVDSLAPVHKAQVISYLKATGHQLGLLMNFNSVLLSEGVRRIIVSDSVE